MSLWSRLRGRWRQRTRGQDGEGAAREKGPVAKSPASTPAPASVPVPEPDGPAIWLEQLVNAVEQGALGPENEARLLQDRALALAEQLIGERRETRVVAALGRIHAARPDLHRVGLRLGLLLLDLGLEERGIPLLRGLLDSGMARRVEAHLALAGFYAAREGGAQGEARALAHYEAVLAHEFAHPVARARADDLRRRVEAAQQVRPAPTLLGVQDLGAGARYEIKRELGRGGGGTVYLARDSRLDRPVALKILHPHVGRAAGAREHLFCEARIAGAISHPNIITILDLDEQLNMVVMEYCAGGTLAGALPLEPAGTLGVLRRLAVILDLVHRCGVIHRDLKPSNLLLRRPGDTSSLVLTDFGVAHIGQEAGGQDGLPGGSLIYMAPEQRSGGAVGPTADLYSCGVMMLEMLIGRPPLDGAQALRGVNLLELAPCWEEAGRGDLPTVRQGMLDLARSLVDPEPGRRPESAQAMAARVETLIELEVRAQDQLAVQRRMAGQGGI